MRIGILTGGGDCPGLNAVIRAVVLTARRRHGDEHRGVPGRLARSHRRRVGARSTRRAAGTSFGRRDDPRHLADESVRHRRRARKRCVRTLERQRASTRSWRSAARTPSAWPTASPNSACKAVGVPKTIDNDLAETEFTFGFDTAVQIATDAVDRLRTTAESHHRVIVCEVMGRHAGWIAAYTRHRRRSRRDIGSGGSVRRRRRVRRASAHRHAGGQFSSIVVDIRRRIPAEGPDADAARRATATDAVDAFGHARLGGIGEWLAREIELRTGFEARTTILGHVQRGGTPTARDRVLATRFGVGGGRRGSRRRVRHDGGAQRRGHRAGADRRRHARRPRPST